MHTDGVWILFNNQGINKRETCIWGGKYDLLMLFSPGHCIATYSQMALPERIHYQHLVQTGSTQQHQCGQRQTIPLLVSPTLFWGMGTKKNNPNNLGNEDLHYIRKQCFCLSDELPPKLNKLVDIK